MWFLIFALVCCEVSSELQQDLSDVNFSSTASQRRIVPDNSSITSISLPIARTMNTLGKFNYSDLIEDFPAPAEIIRVGRNSQSRAIRPEFAKCMPESTVVRVVKNPEPSTIYFPACIRVKRCGGCCQNSLLACEPTANNTIYYEITATTINYSTENHKPFRFKNAIIVPIEEHTACRCVCAIKETDCNSNQMYKPEECRCQCKNLDEKENCKAGNAKKTWNPELCICQCQEVEQCPTNFYFDPNTCSCKKIVVEAWSSDNRRPNYSFNTPRPSQSLPVLYPPDVDDSRKRR